MKNLKQSLLYALLIAVSAGLLFHALFNLLITRAIDNAAQGSDGDIASILVSVLLVAAFVNVFMVIAVAVSSLIAGFCLSALKIPQAFKSMVLATPILCVIWYFFIQWNLTEDMPAWILSIVSFVMVYITSLLILTKIPTKR